MPKESINNMPGFWELILLLVICLLLFGTRKLPEIGAGLGRGLANFRKNLHQTKSRDTSNDSKSSED